MPSQRLRILLGTSTMEAGGSERQLLYLLRGLDRSLFEPMLYLLYDTGSLLAEIPADVPRFSFWGENQQPALDWPGRIHGLQIKHLEKTLRRERVDVAYDRLFHMTMIAGPATRRAAVPRVSTIVSPPEFDVGRADNRWRWIKRRRLARAYRECAALLTVAAGTADNAARYYYIPRDRFRVVPGPIDLLRIDALSRRNEGLAHFANDRAHLLAVGRLSREKGHATLIDAVARYLRERTDDRLPNIDLHIAGDGPLMQTLADQAAQLGIQDHVHLHGHVSNPYAMMRRSDLLCMPSLYEGMPNAMLEAMACEVPVVASNTEQGPGELLRQHPIGQLVPVGDVAAWCEAIKDRFRRAPEWHTRATQANLYVRQNHDLDRWLETMSQLFLSVAARTQSS